VSVRIFYGRGLFELLIHQTGNAKAFKAGKRPSRKLPSFFVQNLMPNLERRRRVVCYMWIWILIVFVVGGAILGILKSDSGKETEGSLFGAFSGLMEGGGCLLYLLLMLILLIAFFWLFS
jgi:hypothetical protein